MLELVEGGDLYANIVQRKARRDFMPEASIWALFYQVCLGLNELHSRGIVHRDIKTLNILLSKDHKTAKIADLGVSRQVTIQ